MKKNLLLAILLFSSLLTCAQHQADKWFFGVYAGLDFTGGSPVALYGDSIDTNEGCSSVSDSTGTALFYTDGVSVWNKNNHVMPNGTGLMGGISATQSALIVPQPGSDSLYYIFTVDEIGGPNGFRYSIVDMSLNGGLGDVMPGGNVMLLDSVTEKLTAVQRDFGTNYWIAVHRWGNDEFDVYSLTSTGLTATPVISNTGIVHRTDVIQNTYGQMKFSPCSDKLALAAGYLDTVEVFDFNPSTGIVSNPLTIPFNDHVYGLEFSLDGSKLYVSTYDPAGTLVQYDLAAGNTAAVIASKTVLSATADIYALQLGSDQKIYVCRSFSSWLGVINNPAVSGFGCNYVDNGVDLDPSFTGVTSALGLPGFVQSYFRTGPCLLTGLEQPGDEEKNILYPNPASGEFNLLLSLRHPETDITIYDETGKLLAHHVSEFEEQKFSFGKSFLPGVYFVRLENNEHLQVMKAVKMPE